MVWLRQRASVWLVLGWVIFGLSQSAWGQTDRTQEASESLPTLRVGDVILIQLACYSCGVISSTTGSPFSHSGLVLEFSQDGEPMVAQALSQVETIPLAAFLSQAKRHSRLMVRRSHELAGAYKNNSHLFRKLAARMKRHFDAVYRGQPFDDGYLWDNRDASGKELLYCSELVQKTLNHVLSRPLPPIAMDFSANWEFWQKYFGGSPPQGLPGNSPGSLAASELLSTVWDGVFF